MQFSKTTKYVLALAGGLFVGAGFARGQLCGLNERQELTADDGWARDWFGKSVAISGDTALIGASGDNDVCPGDIHCDSGSAYLFEKVGDVWTQTPKLTAADGAAGDLFGSSVAVSGATGVIGAPRDDDACPGEPNCNSGSAYVFEKFGEVWTQRGKLTAGDGTTGDWFAFSVAVSGDTVVIGAPHDDDLGSASGSAYVFEKVGGVWTEVAKLTAADGAAGDYFGNSVAVSVDTVVVGAHYDDDHGDFSGSAYVFEKLGGVWTQRSKLSAPDGAAGDEFGFSVAISEETAVIGAPHDDDLGNASGSAYVFERVAGIWIETGKLTAPDGAVGDFFGDSVAVSGETAVIGAWGDDSLVGESGSAYVFEKDGGVWTQAAKLTAADDVRFHFFARSVAVSGDTVVIGAPGDDDLGTDAGAAYVFDVGVDCNRNGIPDECDIREGTSQDLNGNGVPDECEECVDDANCEDDQPCTANVCDAGTCTYPPKLVGAPCGDPGDTACDHADTCDGLGTCLDNIAPDGTPCRDDSFCNGQETCQAGECTDGTAPCVDLGHCDEESNRCLPCIQDDECDDEDPCTEDACVKNECVRTPRPGCEAQAHFDIKPGSCPNPVNPKSKGVVPAAIVGSESFGVTQIDIDSLTLTRNDGVGGVVAPLAGPRGPRITVEDAATPFDGDLCDCHELGADGIDDLVLKFSTPELAHTFRSCRYPHFRGRGGGLCLHGG